VTAQAAEVINMKTFNSTDCAAMAIRRMTPSGKAVTTTLLTLTVALALGGCSKKQTANSNQNASTQTAASQVATIESPTPAASSLPDVPKKKNVKGPVKKLPAFLTYKNDESGVSFTYPRKSRLEVGEKAEQDMLAEEQVPMNFIGTGGSMLAVVEMPGVPKSGTDFVPAFFTASISKGLTAEQCALFRSQAPQQDSPESGGKAQSAIPISTVTLGGVEYTEFDKLSEQQSVKYYHRFVAGSSPEESGCYEFGMAVRTADHKQDDDTANWETQQKDAFTKLEKILASVNIKSDVKPTVVEAAKADVTSTETAKTEGAKTEAAKTEAAKADEAKQVTKVDDNPR
jgi:hypothetical protein